MTLSVIGSAEPPVRARTNLPTCSLRRERRPGNLALVTEPLPRWAKLFVGTLLVGIVALLVRSALDDGLGKPAQAEWRVVPGTVLAPGDTDVPIDVHETKCASGRSADGRVVVEVKYDTTLVWIDVSVRPFGGDLTCPSNPDTSFVVELDEPLDGRAIVGERWPAP
jgi:hypothetical protein